VEVLEESRQEISATISDLRAEIWTRNRQNTKQEWFPFGDEDVVQWRMVTYSEI
jgi:hypothetical protein